MLYLYKIQFNFILIYIPLYLKFNIIRIFNLLIFCRIIKKCIYLKLIYYLIIIFENNNNNL